MTQAEQPQKESRKIKRTICIGLGGTGKDVLMRIRRAIVDRHGDLTEMPLVSFVHIDTDKNAFSGLKTGNIYRGVDLSFRDADQVAATMKPVDISNLSQGLDQSAKEERKGPYAHISRWFPPQLLKDLKAIEEGAKGIRPVGRLAFFHNYRKIKAALETAERRTRGHEAFLIRKGFIIDPGLNIFVVGSLCGGTGSGMCIDIAYCLKKLYGDQGTQIFGYLVISPELYGNNPMMNANTYAALKELNYYATPGTRFEALYDPQNIEMVQETRPPFEYVYLISNQTATDYRILQKSKLANVIAHKIILDFAGELAPSLKEPRDNFLVHMIQQDEHPRPNIQRYLTFGLAQMYFPRDITVMVALNRIRIKLIDFWLNGEGQSPDIPVLLDRFLLNWRPDGSREDCFSPKLEEAAQDGNKSFNQSLNSWRNKLESQINETKSKDDRTGLREQLSRAFREQFRQVQPGETESTRGIWLTMLEQSTGKITAKLKQDINIFIADLLNPKNLDFSLNATRAFLEALVTTLNKYQRQIEDKLQKSGSLSRLDDVERKWKEAEQVIEDQENKKGIPLFNNRKNEQFQEEAKGIVRTISDLIKNNFNFAVTQQALQIVKALQLHTQTLLSIGSSFDNSLKTLKSAYEKRETELKQLNSDEMSGEAIFESDDTDDCYKTLLPERERRNQLVSVTTKITEKSGFGDSLAGFLGTNGFLDDSQLQQEIDLTVDRLFGSRSSNMVQSVIKRFMQSYSSSERSTRLEQIIRESEPLLPLNTADPYFYNDPAKSVRIIGFKDTEQTEVRQFKELLTKELGVPYHVFKPIQAEDEIWILNEVAGFPLRIVGGLDQMRMQYIRHQNFPECFLHNDYSVPFTDLIPPEAKKMEKLQDVFYPCLAFDLLTINPSERQYEYQYWDDMRGVLYTAELSLIWNEALEKLSQRQDMSDAIEGILNEALEKIQQDPSQWEEYYQPRLRKFVQDVDDLSETHPNYPYRATVVGTRAKIDSPAKDGIITRFQKRMQAMVNDKTQLSSGKTSRASHQLLTGTKNAGATPKASREEVIDIYEPEDLTHQRDLDFMTTLKELAQLKRDGLLSEAQFEAAKRKLGL